MSVSYKSTTFIFELSLKCKSAWSQQTLHSSSCSRLYLKFFTGWGLQAWTAIYISLYFCLTTHFKVSFINVTSYCRITTTLYCAHRHFPENPWSCIQSETSTFNQFSYLPDFNHIIITCLQQMRWEGMTHNPFHWCGMSLSIFPP